MALPRNLLLLIESLRRAHPAGRTADALARELDIQPWRVGELLSRAEALGFPIRHGGTTLSLEPSDCPLVADLIELGSQPQRVGRSVIVFEQTASTNDVCRQAARRRHSDGLIVLAEHQSAGRGRQGRTWLDTPGASLLFSVLLLDERLDEGQPNRLMMSASVALAEAVRAETDVAAVIRWPNDLYVHGRKLAGILLETRRGEGDGPLLREDARRGTVPCDVVIGIGLNCNQGEDDLAETIRSTATSLRIETGHRVDRTGVLRSAIGRLDHWLARAAPPTDALHARYLELMDQQARRVRLVHDGESIEGTVRDVDPNSGLLVELPAGGVAHFAPADVSVEWLGDRPAGEADNCLLP